MWSGFIRNIYVLIMELYDEEDYDMSWLTQVQSIESQKLSFDLLREDDGSDSNLFEDIFGEERRDSCGSQIVSLEENVTIKNGKVLYDNVMVEDISSDEAVDTVWVWNN